MRTDAAQDTRTEDMQTIIIIIIVIMIVTVTVIVIVS